MSMNSISEIPAFQVVDPSSMELEDSKPLIQSLQTNATDPLAQAPIKIEPTTVSAPVVTTTSSTISHSTPVTSISTSTSVPTASSSQSFLTQTTSNHSPKGTQSTSSSSTTSTNHDQILTKTRLQDLVKEIDPCEQLDEEVEDLLLQLVDDFVTSTVNTACMFAKHRNANVLEVKDVQLYLEKTYNMWIPGFGTEEVKPYKKPPITEAHKQRLALIRKSLRKY